MTVPVPRPPGVEIKAITKDVPGIDDRALLDVVNRIGVAKDLTAHRSGESVSSRILSTVIGTDRERQLRTLRALTDNQREIFRWVTEIANGVTITGLCLERVTQHLRHVRDVATAAHELSLRNAAELRELADVVARIAAECERRLHQLELRVAVLERANSARESLDQTVSRWQAGLSYSRLPWLCQVILLARESASGPCGAVEHYDGNTSYRERLTNVLISDRRSKHGASSAGLPRYLAEMIDATTSRTQVEVAGWLLEIGLPGALALPNSPLTSTVLHALELAALPDGTRPGNVPGAALDLARQRYGGPDGFYRVQDLVRILVDDQFAGAGDVRARQGRR